jgi:hypothetical protein
VHKRQLIDKAQVLFNTPHVGNDHLKLPPQHKREGCERVNFRRDIAFIGITLIGCQHPTSQLLPNQLLRGRYMNQTPSNFARFAPNGELLLSEIPGHDGPKGKRGNVLLSRKVRLPKRLLTVRADLNEWRVSGQ